MKWMIGTAFIIMLLLGMGYFVAPDAPEPNSQIPAVTPDEAIQASQQSRQRLLKINWGVTPEAPFHISEGPDQGQGFCDVLLQRLAVYLPDVRQERIVDSHSNIRLRMQQHQQVCFPCTLYQAKPPSTENRIYSKPTHFYRPHGIIVRKEIAQTVKAQFGDPIDLALLLQSNYQYSLPPARRFGDLQPLLDKYPKNHQRIASINSTQDVFRLVNQGALDFSIDYQSALIYYNRSEQHNLMFIPIQGQPQLLAGAISCPDSNWGQLAILRINQVVEKIRHDETLAESLEFWQGTPLPADNSPAMFNAAEAGLQ